MLERPREEKEPFCFFYLGDFVQEREVYESILSLSQLIKRRAKVAVIVEGKDEGVFVANGAGFCKKWARHCLDVVAEPFVLCKIGIGLVLVLGV